MRVEIIVNPVHYLCLVICDDKVDTTASVYGAKGKGSLVELTLGSCDGNYYWNHYFTLNLIACLIPFNNS